MHEFAAAYALNALSEEEQARFEEHLRGCAACAAEIESLFVAASQLAFAEASPAPPRALRSRILDAARAEGAQVVPLRTRRGWGFAVGPALAVAAAAVAVGLGIWATSLRHSLAQERGAVSILGDPTARRLPVRGAPGTLVVGRSGEAALAVALPQPPAGKRYEAWVMSPKPHRAALFSTRPTKLSLRVRRGDVVAVTLERAAGVDAPTSKPLLSVRA